MGAVTAWTADESHSTRVFQSRYFQDVTEIWCPNLDETKGVLGYRYVRNCPMCGDEIDVEEPEVSLL